MSPRRFFARAAFKPAERLFVEPQAALTWAWVEGEDEYHAVADAGRVESFRTELDGGWSEYAVGANFKLAPHAFVWADLEKIAGGDIRENYRYTISARRVW